MNRRCSRKLLVDPRYQFVQMAVVVVGNVLVTLLIAGLLSWFYLVGWDGSVVVNHNHRIPVYVAVAALTVTVTTVFFSLRRSRAIAGMMRKMHVVLEDAVQGRFPEQRLVFRKNDYYPHLAEPLNLCLERMRQAQSDPVSREWLRHLLSEIDGGRADLESIRCRLAEILVQENSGPKRESPR